MSIDATHSLSRVDVELKQHDEQEIMMKVAAQPWSEAEHILLVDATNKQIEKEDRSGEEPMLWTLWWRDNIVPLLAKHGYNRTAGACNLYWARVLRSQEATIKAAGTGWTKEEDELLISATEAQLDAEERDPDLQLEWEEWFRRVAALLKKAGFTRSKLACEARYTMEVTNSHMVNKFADRLKQAADSELETETSEVDEKEDMTTKVMGGSLRDVSNSPAASVRSHLIVTLKIGSDNLTNILAKIPNPKAVTYSAQEDRHSSTLSELSDQDEPQESDGLQDVNEPEVAYIKRRKRGPKNHFQPDQRAFLNAEAEENGNAPDAARRNELAVQLGVTEFIIRNWFVNYRAKISRLSGSNMNSPARRSVTAPDSSRKPKRKRPSNLVTNDLATEENGAGSAQSVKRSRKPDRSTNIESWEVEGGDPLSSIPSDSPGGIGLQSQDTNGWQPVNGSQPRKSITAVPLTAMAGSSSIQEPRIKIEPSTNMTNVVASQMSTNALQPAIVAPEQRIVSSSTSLRQIAPSASSQRASIGSSQPTSTPRVVSDKRPLPHTNDTGNNLRNMAIGALAAKTKTPELTLKAQNPDAAPVNIPASAPKPTKPVSRVSTPSTSSAPAQAPNPNTTLKKPVSHAPPASPGSSVLASFTPSGSLTEHILHKNGARRTVGRSRSPRSSTTPTSSTPQNGNPRARPPIPRSNPKAPILLPKARVPPSPSLTPASNDFLEQETAAALRSVQHWRTTITANSSAHVLTNSIIIASSDKLSSIPHRQSEATKQRGQQVAQLQTKIEPERSALQAQMAKLQAEMARLTAQMANVQGLMAKVDEKEEKAMQVIDKDLKARQDIIEADRERLVAQKAAYEEKGRGEQLAFKNAKERLEACKTLAGIKDDDEMDLGANGSGI